jgi:hypothetical protein
MAKNYFKMTCAEDVDERVVQMFASLGVAVFDLNHDFISGRFILVRNEDGEVTLDCEMTRMETKNRARRAT